MVYFTLRNWYKPAVQPLPWLPFKSLMVNSTAEDITHLRKGEIRLILTRKHPPLALIVLEGSFHVTRGKKKSKDLYCFEPCKQQYGCPGKI